MRKIFVVSNKHNAIYANKIKGALIKEKIYSVSCWTDEQYIKDTTPFSTHNYFIFVGPTKTTKAVMPFVNWEDKGCGIKYGRLGNQFFVYAEAVADETKFIKYAEEEWGKLGGNNLYVYDPKSYNLYPEDADFSKPEDVIAGALATIVGAPLKLGMKGIELVEFVTSRFDVAKILKIKYKLIIAEFLREVFLNEEFKEKAAEPNYYEHKLILVAPKKYNPYAQILLAAIYDSGISADASVVSLDFYNHQKYDSRNKIIFIGNSNRKVKSIAENIDWKYNNNGMQYGWYGNDAVILSKKPKIIEASQQKYFEFMKQMIEEIKQYGTAGVGVYTGKTLIKQVGKINKINKMGKPIMMETFTFNPALLIPSILLDDFIEKLIKDNTKSKTGESPEEKLLRNLYIINKFVNNDLITFLEE